MVKGFFKFVQDLSDKSWQVRRDAARALGELNDTRAVNPPIVVLEDEDERVQRRGTESLGQLRVVRAIESLITVLDDDEERVREAAAQSLDKLLQRIAAHVSVASILSIDDEPEMIDLIKLILEAVNFQVTGAVGGREGLEVARRTRPDLILLDLGMPDMFGGEVWARLKNTPSTAKIPIIIVTAYPGGKDPDLYFFEVDDYIIKPFGPQELLQSINKVLGLHVTFQPQKLVPSVARVSELSSRNGQDALEEEVKRLRRQRQALVRRVSTLEQEKKNGAELTPFQEIESLISGIVHDLRGGLGVIRLTSGFMLDDVSDRHLVTDLQKIVRSAEFCDIVIRNLMAVIGGEEFKPVEVNIETVVREVFFMLERKLVDVNLVVNVAPNTPTIMADEGQMKQVFMNLIKNAGEAMPDGGTLSVRTRREKQMIRIDVGDTGCGISPENQGRVFQEFFTTKEQGYGLGLYIVDSVVKRHGGTVKVTSRVDVGTVFTLHLPIEPE